MKILGIDTSSKFLSIALHEFPRIKNRIPTNLNVSANSCEIRGHSCLIKEENHLLDRQHCSLLFPKIKEMLERSGFSIKDIDAFVVGLGPGSFTGLRIGVSAVKGFGIATKKPCIGVSSIDAIAMNVDSKEGNVVPIIDAKRQNVYSAIYERGIKKSKYLLLNIDELMKKIKGPAVFLGDGVTLYKKKISSINKKAVFLEEGYWYPRANNLIKLVLPRLNRFKKGDLSKLNPIYLYPRDCQVKRGHNLRSGAT